VDKNLIKKFGQEAFITGAQLEESQHDIVHVSPKIDIVLGSGIPGGSVVTLSGEPKAGKTLTSLHILAKAQKVGRPVYYVNVEGRIKPRDLQGIKDLDLEKLNIIRSYKETDSDGNIKSKILNAEEFIETVEYICHNVPGAVVVVDSISQLTTASEFDKNIDEQARAPGAMLMSRFCRRMANVIPVNDIILIGILHIVSNTGMGKKKFETGGNKMKFARDIGLQAIKFTYFTDKMSEKEEDDKGKIIGQRVEWLTTSTALASPPGQKTESIIKFGIGIDELAELVEVGIDLGFIRKSGGWYYLEFLNEKEKCQGKPALVDRIRNNKEEFKLLEKALHELLVI
jgi:recombination protein RecA